MKSCLLYTFPFLRGREGGDMAIKCHAERDRTWHKLGRHSTASPLFTPALGEYFLSFLFLAWNTSSILHWDILQQQNLNQDKIRNLRLPDSVLGWYTTPILFHMCTNDVLALSANGIGYLLVDVMSNEQHVHCCVSDCYTKATFLSSAFGKFCLFV